MKAAIYARYSSENQRPQSIEDQISTCRQFAIKQGFSIEENHIYSDQAKSGANKDRHGLNSLIEGARNQLFQVVLVDDLSRLARDNFLMLTVLADLNFQGIRVISVADGLDSGDQESTLGIQIRGIFNELQLQDLKKKTMRGLVGQKQRGFSCGERTFGYTSVPVGEIRFDKKGKERPEGYKKEIDPLESSIVLRVFELYRDGNSINKIVNILNQEGVPTRNNFSKCWSLATIGRMLDNEKYIGKWTWNKTGSRRDPRTGRRKKFDKPESEWIVQTDENLRIVPQDLWDNVRARRIERKKSWPGGKGKRGFENKKGSVEKHFPKELFSGAMNCKKCGSTIGKVSGKNGGYFGCLGTKRGICDNKVKVRRTVLENIILHEIKQLVSTPNIVHCILEKIERKVRKMYSDFPSQICQKERELISEERKLANFINFIGEGKGTISLNQALLDTENKIDSLKNEICFLNNAYSKVIQAPTIEWIEERLSHIQKLLERSVERSAMALRNLLGPIELEPVLLERGKPYYIAHTTFETISILEDKFAPSQGGKGANQFHWWSQAGSNRRPLQCHCSALPTELWPRRKIKLLPSKWNNYI